MSRAWGLLKVGDYPTLNKNQNIWNTSGSFRILAPKVGKFGKTGQIGPEMVKMAKLNVAKGKFQSDPRSRAWGLFKLGD